MYANIASQNPILNNFNTYMARNPTTIPFQNNQLINNNVHVMNNLNDYIQQTRNPLPPQLAMGPAPLIPTGVGPTGVGPTGAKKLTNCNIIEEMLTPRKIVKDNKDVRPNYRVREDIQLKAKKGDINIEMTNAPYKTIIKDKIITKKVQDVKLHDLLVHKAVRAIDADVKKFDIDLLAKQGEKTKINEELKMEFHWDNYDKHKKKFEYKETFIKNLAFEQKTFDESKDDYIEFYRQKQREAEEGQKLCDEILHKIIDEGIISNDELLVGDESQTKQ